MRQSWSGLILCPPPWQCETSSDLTPWSQSPVVHAEVNTLQWAATSASVSNIRFLSPAQDQLKIMTLLYTCTLKTSKQQILLLQSFSSWIHYNRIYIYIEDYFEKYYSAATIIKLSLPCDCVEVKWPEQEAISLLPPHSSEGEKLHLHDYFVCSSVRAVNKCIYQNNHCRLYCCTITR